MEDAGQKMLLKRMDEAFSDYSHQAELLSVFLTDTKDPSSWSSYHELLKIRTAEIVAYDKYSKIKNELFSLIPPPVPHDRPKSSVN